MSILKTNQITDLGGNNIISSNGSGTFTSGFASEFFSTTGFQAYQSGGDFTISNNTFTTAPLATTEYNFGNNFDTSTYVYTAPSTGYYNFNVTIMLYNPTARNFMVRISKNNSGTAKQSRREDGADGKQDLESIHVNAVIQLNAGDNVRFQGYIEMDSSSDRRILGGQSNTYVKGERIA